MSDDPFKPDEEEVEASFIEDEAPAPVAAESKAPAYVSKIAGKDEKSGFQKLEEPSHPLLKAIMPVVAGAAETATRGTGPTVLNQALKVENFLREKFGGEPRKFDYRQAVDKVAEEEPWKFGAGAMLEEIPTQVLLGTATGGASMTPAGQAAQSGFQRMSQELGRGKTGFDVINPALGDGLASAVLPVVGAKAAQLVPQEYKIGAKMLADKASVPAVSLKNYLAKKFGDFADERAVKSVASGENLSKLVGPLKGVSNEARKARVAGAADYMRQPREELEGEPILKKFLTSEDLAERYGTVEKGVGEKYNALLGDLSEHEVATDKYPATQMADELEQEIADQFPHGANKPRRDFLQNEVNNIRNDPEQDLGLLGIEGNKRGFQGRADYSRVQSDDKEALKWLASRLKERGENQADSVVSQYAPELGGKFQALKKDFSMAAAGADAGSAEAGRALKNRAFTPSDYVAPLITKGNNDSALDKILNVASMGGHKLMRERGSSTLAVGAKNLADLFSGTKASSPQLQRTVEQTFGAKYAPAIIGAIVRGTNVEETILKLAEEDPAIAAVVERLSE